MKNAKKIVALLLCAVLLVGASVAGTLAYLTQKTKTVQNTFTVGKVSLGEDTDNDGLIDNGLDEAKVNEYGEKLNAEGNVAADGYKMTEWTGSDGTSGTVATSSQGSWTYTVSSMLADITITVTTAPIEYKITYDLRDGELGEGVTNPETYTVETESFTLKNPARTGYKFLGWATSADAAAGSTTVTIEKGTTGDLTYYAVWERSLVDLTITAQCEDQQQNFIFTVSGIRSDGVTFEPIDVVLCSDNGFKVTIKDLFVGTYTVTEKNNWSWRENPVESKTANLTTKSQTVSFDFETVNDLHWLSGYSYKRKKGDS